MMGLREINYQFLNEGSALTTHLRREYIDEKNTIRVGTYILPPGEEQSKKIKVKRPLLSDVASSASIMYFTASFPKKLNGGNTSTK